MLLRALLLAGLANAAHLTDVLPQSLSQATLAGGEAVSAVSEQLLRHGFVLVRPSPEQLRAIDDIDAVASQLFAQPVATKAHIEASMTFADASDQVALRRPELQLSCTGLRLRPAACSAGYTGHRRQHHEQFHVVMDPTALDIMRWPSAGLPALRPAVEGAGDVLQELSEALLRSIAPELHDLWTREISKRGDPSVLDLFHYGGCQRSNSTCVQTKEGDCNHCDAVGMSEHVDPGIFTCKHMGAAQVDGLQLLDRASGEWVDESSFRGHVVCFVDQLLADWCLANHRPPVTATLHRVVPAGEAPRQSIVYEMRAPKIDVWRSPEQWSRAKRAEKKREAQAERKRRRRREGSGS